MRHRWGSGAAVVAAFLIACGGEPSVASKSAQAYREADANGAGSPRAAAAQVAPSSAHEAPGTADAHAGMDHGDHSANPAVSPADHAAMGHGAAAGAVDHSAHASPTDHAAMGHAPASAGGSHAGHGTARSAPGAMDHSAMGHATNATSAAHSGHGARARNATGAKNHAAMGHGSSSATPDHAGHRTTAGGSAAAAVDHAAMGHQTTTRATDHAAHAAQPGSKSTPEAHAGHTDHADHRATPAGASQHAGHGVPPGADPHVAHGVAASPAGERVVVAAPRTNAALRQLRPGTTLEPDAFDAARPAPVAEAAKARAPMDHSGHMRGITAGEDEANPPTPMPATRDGDAFRGTSAAPPTGHDHSGGTSAGSTPAAEAMYSCPMHPEVTSDEPGTCPKCGMALEKRK